MLKISVWSWSHRIWYISIFQVNCLDEMRNAAFAMRLRVFLFENCCVLIWLIWGPDTDLYFWWYVKQRLNQSNISIFQDQERPCGFSAPLYQIISRFLKTFLAVMTFKYFLIEEGQQYQTWLVINYAQNSHSVLMRFSITEISMELRQWQEGETAGAVTSLLASY